MTSEGGGERGHDICELEVRIAGKGEKRQETAAARVF